MLTRAVKGRQSHTLRRGSIAAALMSLLAGLAAAADLPKWDLATIEDLDPTKWGPAETDGAEAYRAVKAGRIVNDEQADTCLRSEYRKGWSL
jgi:hypothetical protein